MYAMILNLFWSECKYIVYKLLAFGYFHNLNQFVRHCDSHLKVVKTRSNISTQVFSSVCVYIDVLNY